MIYSNVLNWIECYISYVVCWFKKAYLRRDDHSGSTFPLPKIDIKLFSRTTFCLNSGNTDDQMLMTLCRKMICYDDYTCRIHRIRFPEIFLVNFVIKLILKFVVWLITEFFSQHDGTTTSLKDHLGLSAVLPSWSASNIDINLEDLNVNYVRLR